MKKVLLLLMLVLMPTLLMAQAAGGVVKRPVKKTESVKRESKKQESKKQQTKKKDEPQKQEEKRQEVMKSAEEAGYDVTFDCNVPSATLSIDGTTSGTASGTRFLKTGSHSVRLTANGYEPLSQTITVSRSSTFFSFTMKQEERVVKSAEEAGYDVTFNCNVPSATLSIDGTTSSTASGTRFLKTGSHSVRLTANGYEPLSQTISVSRSSTYFSFTMKQEERKLSPVLQTLINNMVRVEGGTFTMGATPEQDSDADADEKPAHQVTLSSFSIGKYEVTQEEWEAVMGSNPSIFNGAKRPVENVSWEDCQTFISKLNQLTGKRFRLPTEAEWEYAARGGNHSRGYKYAGSNDVGSVAWYDDNSDKESHPVGQKSPNEIGLYDMSGNVWEWCQDWYGDYSSSSQTNPTGASSGSLRVYHGGCWRNRAGDCRSSYRYYRTPSIRNDDLGLRLAL